MQESYDVVVVGGGIVGCSIAYHLARDTNLSVCLLERHTLTSGTTWHAAGLVAELRASANLTRLARYSGELYETLQDQGEALGYRRVGALTLALNADRAFELKKQAAMARHNQVDCEWLSAKAITERWPHISTTSLAGGVYMPNDGQTNPVDTTLALARVAKQHGAVIKEHTEVTALRVEYGVIQGVDTAQGNIGATQVVLACGLWTRDLGKSVGADFPLYPAEHFYAVTEPVSVPGDQPIVRVPDEGIYLKPEAGRYLIGCFEREAKPVSPQALPAPFNFAELPFDLDHFLPYLDAGLKRLPDISEAGIRTWFNGPESFTPDGRYMLGESPQVEQLFVAAGFNSIGIQSAGGVGKVMASWLADRQPPMDLWEVDVRRFQPEQNQEAYLVPRTAESLGRLYAMHWPFLQFESVRNQRRSPLHDDLAQRGACFGELALWERPNWYGQPGSTPRYNYTYGRPTWFDATAAECRAVRDHVALFDQTSFAKYQLDGADAQAFLDLLCTANMNVPVGKVVYCQWLNDRGGIEADVTVTRLSATRYWVISAAACAVRDMHWMRRHRQGYDVKITDITQQWAVIGVMGPAARSTLQVLTDTDLTNEAFPFATSQAIELAGVKLRATRITYVGELGWELYIPWQHARKVYAALARLPLAGYHAMDALRMEKGYRHWGHDVSEEDTPVQAGLSFTVDWSKTAHTFGLESLAEEKKRGPDRRLALFSLRDADVLLTHDEPVWLNGKRVGHVTSSAYSHILQRSLAFAYISAKAAPDRKSLLAGSYQLEVGNRQVGADVSLRPLYDPDNLKVLC